jgi:endoglucanase
MWQAKGGGPYGDNEVKDDFYWAACELFVSAKEMGDSSADTYLSELSDYKDAFKVTTRITGGENASGEGSFTTFNWGNTASAGSLAWHSTRIC